MLIIRELLKFFSFLSNIIMNFFIRNNGNKCRNTIVIVRTDGIGDILIWLSEIERIKKRYKNKKLVLITNESIVSLIKNINLFNEVIGINVNNFNRKLIYKYQILKKLKKNRYEVLINPIYSRSIASEGIALNINADWKITNSGDLSNINKIEQKISNFYYDEIINITQKDKSEFFYNNLFTNLLIGENQKIKLFKLKIFNEKVKNKSESYCVFFLGSSEIRKCWEIEKFLKVAEKIKIPIILCGGKNEEKIGGEFFKNSLNKNIINKIGKTSLYETAKIIKEAKFILSTDTFAVHLAAILGTKSIVILGGGHFERFLPYPKELENENNEFLPEVIYKKMECFNCNWRCKYDDIPWRCIKNIQEKDITKLNLFYIE